MLVTLVTALLFGSSAALSTLQVRQRAVVQRKATLQVTRSDGTPLALSGTLISRRSLLVVAPSVAAAVARPQEALAAGKKVVVLGGAGYVGSHVAQLLAKEGVQVVSVSRSSAAEQQARTTSVLGGQRASRGPASEQPA